jgi:hypothetical protein
MSSIQRIANIILIVAGTSCALFFVFSMARHGWAWHYLVFPMLGAAFLGALTLHTSAKVNLALFLVSAAIALYGAEAFLGQVGLSATRFSLNDWLNFPEDADSSVAITRIKEEKSANASFDTRTRLQVVRDLRKQGVKAFPDVFPTVLFQSTGKGVIRSLFSTGNGEFLPLASISNVTTVFCNESGEYIIYRSDDHGFHNPPGLWEPGKADIVALGDSYAHGACVPSDHGFVSVIRSRYPATINLGINGDGPLTMLATLKEYAAFLSPKLVLWFYYEGNDLRDLDGREKYSPLLRRYLGRFSQDLIARQQEVDQVLTEYLEQAMKSQAASFDGERFLKLHHLRASLWSVVNKRKRREGLQIELVEHMEKHGASSTHEDLELFRSVLKEASETVSSWGGRMYFVYLPTWERYRLPDLASEDRENVLRIVDDLGIPTVDIHLSFARHPDPLSLFPSRRYAHYNEVGHRLVAEEVMSRLEQADLHVKTAGGRE